MERILPFTCRAVRVLPPNTYQNSAFIRLPAPASMSIR